jgi:hypothetical protein
MRALQSRSGLLGDERSSRAVPGKLQSLVKVQWEQAAQHKILPLDDRFAPWIIENATRFHGQRKHYVLHSGVGHGPTEIAHDVRSRSYSIEAARPFARRNVRCAGRTATPPRGTVSTCQIHDMNIGGEHVIVRSDRSVFYQVSTTGRSRQATLAAGQAKPRDWAGAQ